MAETQETIADIIAEKRFDAMTRDQFDSAYIVDLCDRFDAAHKREVREAVTDCNQFGDAAKLREALERVLCWLKRMNAQPLNTLAISELTPSHAVNRTAKSIIEDNDYHISRLTAALAAPPRNCDLYTTVDEARAAHEAICEKYVKCHYGCPLNNEENYSAFDCFEAWLFAPATETEGGAK